MNGLRRPVCLLFLGTGARGGHLAWVCQNMPGSLRGNSVTAGIVDRLCPPTVVVRVAWAPVNEEVIVYEGNCPDRPGESCVKTPDGKDAPWTVVAISTASPTPDSTPTP